MGLFKRKPGRGERFGGADRRLVVIPRADADSYLVPLATKAGDRVSMPVSAFIELAEQSAYGAVVTPQHEDDGAAGGAATSWLAATSAKLGYSTRVCEFEHELLVDIADVNEYLTRRLEQFHRERTMGTDWFATLCGTAAMITTTVRAAPYSPDVVDLLAPTGFGHDAHVAVCSWLINGLRANPEAERAMAAGPGEITDQELSACWMYGYYLRACENALPAEACEELQKMQTP
jgi:hypothetical protein